MDKRNKRTMLSRQTIFLHLLLIVVVNAKSTKSVGGSYDGGDYLITSSEHGKLNVSLSSSEQNFKELRLKEPFQIKCPISLLGYSFEQIVFNRSLFNLAETIETESLLEVGNVFKIDSAARFDQLFKNVNYNSNNREVYIEYATFTDTGRYYCVYSMVDTTGQKKYLVSSSSLIVYDEETKVANFESSIVLSACKYEANQLNLIKWYYPSFLSDFLVRVDEGTSNLEVKLYDMRIFDSFIRCEDDLKNVIKFYKIECLNCKDLFSEPIVSPDELSPPEGSSGQLFCKEIPNSREPDRYEWHKISLNDDTAATETKIKTGPLLDLKNMTSVDSGWYHCCLYYSPISPLARAEFIFKYGGDLESYDGGSIDEFDMKKEYLRYCASSRVEVKTSPVMSSNKLLKTRQLMLIIVIAFLVLLSVMILLVFCCYSRLKLMKHAQKAMGTMKHNDIYQDRTETEFLTSSNLSLDQEVDKNELNEIKEIMKNSSSIEKLLSQEDVRRWRIPSENLKLGDILGRGAFGIVIHGQLKHSDDQIRLLRGSDSGLDSSTYKSSSDYGYLSKTAHRFSTDTPGDGKSSVGDTHRMSTNEYTSSDEYKYISMKSVDSSVAVKKLPADANIRSFYDHFKELKLMLNVGQHPNIINLVGYTIESGSLYIVTDYARFGNLKEFLRDNRDLKDGGDYNKMGDETNKTNSAEFVLTTNHLVMYSYQIAMGMEYLHSKKVLHRDLAARNILVYDYDSIKIADFGLARNMRSDYYYVQKSKNKMPLKWMSPEALSYNRISKESDVWSFGILLWEIFSFGSTPYPTIQPEEILSKLLSGYRMEKPDQCPEHVYQAIMLKCWSNEPKSRPKFDELVRSFEHIIDHQPEYVNLRHLLLHTSSNDPPTTSNKKKTCVGEGSGAIDATTSSSSVFLAEPSSSTSSSRSSTNSTSTSTTRAYSNSINSYSSKESLREAFKHENLLLIDEEKATATATGGLSNWKKSVGGASSKKIRKAAINNNNLIYLRSDEADDEHHRDVFEVAEEDSQLPTIKSNDKNKTIHAVKIPKLIVNILK